MKWLSFLPALLALAPVAAEPVLVGKFPAKVVPEQLSVFTLPERGEVTDMVPEGRVEAGAVVAVLNKQRTQEEREDMEFQLSKERLACRDELRKLQQQRQDLEFYLNLSDRERRYASANLPAGMSPTPESLQDIDERISLATYELNTMEKRRRDKFERDNESRTLRMPFSGRLQYNITLPEDLSAPMEISGMVQTFATACDDSAFYITISVTRSDLSLLPPEKFRVSIALPEGKELLGHYDRRRVERSPSGADMLVFFFRLAPEDAETAFRMLGSHATASLFYEAEETVERVSKAQLAAHPAAAECEDWAELVERVYPGARMVFVAEGDVVIRKPSAPAEAPPAA